MAQVAPPKDFWPRLRALHGALSKDAPNPRWDPLRLIRANGDRWLGAPVDSPEPYAEVDWLGCRLLGGLAMDYGHLDIIRSRQGDELFTGGPDPEVRMRIAYVAFYAGLPWTRGITKYSNLLPDHTPAQLASSRLRVSDIWGEHPGVKVPLAQEDYPLVLAEMERGISGKHRLE